MITLRVNSERCADCGVCVEECPLHTPAPGTKHADHGHRFCDKCLHCYTVCPCGAIEADGLTPIAMTGGNALYDMFQSRRSSRYFKDAEIDEATLQTLLGSANYIPSGGNAHELVITVVRDAGTKRRLREAVIRYYERTINMTRIPLVKPLLRIFGDGKVKAALGDKEFEAKIRNMIRRDDKRDLVFYDAPAILVFHTARLLPTPSEDCILAAYNITLLAESLGLGTCFVSLSQQALSADQRCRSLIGIAAKEKVHAVLVLGYPLRKHRRIAPRTGVIVRSVRN